MAIKESSPLALVPCCHRLKSSRPENLSSPNPSLTAAAIDQLRVERLSAAGLTVEVQRIPSRFSARNTLILACPPDHDHSKISRTCHHKKIPLGDCVDNIQACQLLSGRSASCARRRALPPRLDLSCWLAGPALISPPTPELVGKLAQAVAGSVATVRAHLPPRVHCAQLGDVFVHPSGRRALAFRLEYESAADENFDDARRAAVAAHEQLRRAFVDAFPGVELR